MLTNPVMIFCSFKCLVLALIFMASVHAQDATVSISPTYLRVDLKGGTSTTIAFIDPSLPADPSILAAFPSPRTITISTYAQELDCQKCHATSVEV